MSILLPRGTSQPRLIHSPLDRGAACELPPAALDRPPMSWPHRLSTQLRASAIWQVGRSASVEDLPESHEVSAPEDHGSEPIRHSAFSSDDISKPWYWQGLSHPRSMCPCTAHLEVAFSVRHQVIGLGICSGWLAETDAVLEPGSGPGFVDLAGGDGEHCLFRLVDVGWVGMPGAPVEVHECDQRRPCSPFAAVGEEMVPRQPAYQDYGLVVEVGVELNVTEPAQKRSQSPPHWTSGRQPPTPLEIVARSSQPIAHSHRIGSRSEPIANPQSLLPTPAAPTRRSREAWRQRGRHPCPPSSR